jgi:hypothetical protein
MTHKSHFLELELKLAELYVQLMLSQFLQHKPQMLLMLFLVLGVDQDIINEHHDKLIQILHKDLVHQVHEVGRCIGQTK